MNAFALVFLLATHFPQLFMVWNPSPVMFSIGNFALRWYGVLFSVGFFASYALAWIQFRRLGRSTQSLDALLFLIIPLSVLGARIAHVFFYEWAYYAQHTSEIFSVWKGGLASHGGGVGLMVAAWIWSRYIGKTSLIWTLDLLAPGTALGGSIIRLGNFMNQEIYGNPTDMPWGVVFKAVDDVPRHPTQLYEFLVSSSIALILWHFSQNKGYFQHRGAVVGMFWVLVFSSRFLLEFTKATQTHTLGNVSLSMGQLLSIPFVIAGIWMWRRAFASANHIAS